MPSNYNTLAFVWNAERSLKGLCVEVVDFVKQTHSCSLCGIAYGSIRPKPRWKEWKQTLGLPTVELYTNHLTAEHKAAIGAQRLPVVLAQNVAGWSVLVQAAEIDACKGALRPFEALVEERLRS